MSEKKKEKKQKYLDKIKNINYDNDKEFIFELRKDILNVHKIKRKYGDIIRTDRAIKDNPKLINKTNSKLELFDDYFNLAQ